MIVGRVKSTIAKSNAKTDKDSELLNANMAALDRIVNNPSEVEVAAEELV